LPRSIFNYLEIFHLIYAYYAFQSLFMPAIIIVFSFVIILLWPFTFWLPGLLVALYIVFIIYFFSIRNTHSSVMELLRMYTLTSIPCLSLHPNPPLLPPFVPTLPFPSLTPNSLVVYFTLFGLTKQTLNLD